MQFDIRRFDIYRKVPKDLTQPTLTGACISICSVLFMLYLFLSELAGFLQHEVVSELIVDDPVKYSEKIPVFLNITLMDTKCEFVGLDIQDDMGRHEVGFQDNTEKIPQNDDNGCRMETHFLINKVPGNFHVSTHAAKSQPTQGDMRHVVHKLRFGMDLEEGKDVKGSFNPMESLDKTNGNAQATHDYIIRVVPSVYVNKDNSKRFPYQYTYSYRIIFIHRFENIYPLLVSNLLSIMLWVLILLRKLKNLAMQGSHPADIPKFKEIIQYGHGGHMMPAIWFRYEMSPITVQYTERRQPIYHFLTTVCAIVGGTFTVAGIFDSCVFTAYEIIRKAELGKLS